MTFLPSFLLSVFLINLCIASPAAPGQRARILPDPTSVHESDSKSIATASSGNHPAVPFNPSHASGHLYWTNTTFKPTETVSSHEMTITHYSTSQGPASSTHTPHPATDDSPSSFASSAPIFFSNHSGSSASLPYGTLSSPVISSPFSGSSLSDSAAAVSVSRSTPMGTFASLEVPSSTVTGAAATSDAAILGRIFIALHANRNWIADARMKYQYIDDVRKAQDETRGLFNNLNIKPAADLECSKPTKKRNTVSERKLRAFLTKRSIISKQVSISRLTDLVKDTANFLSCAIEMLDNLAKTVELPDPPINEI